MKNKLILSFVAGTVFGAAGMFTYLTKIKKIEYEVIEPASAEDNDNEENTSESNTELNESDIPDAQLMDYYKDKAVDEDPIMDYTAFVEDIKRVEPDKEIYERGSKKFLISEEEYIEECELEQHMDTAVISVYADGAVVDETNGMEVVYTDEEIEDFVGLDLMNKFKDDQDERSMFVKNETYRTLYDINKRDELWSEISGEVDEE